MISTKQHKIVMSNLDVDGEELPASMRDQSIEPCSLHYRFQMLAVKLPHNFADDNTAVDEQHERLRVAAAPMAR